MSFFQYPGGQSLRFLFEPKSCESYQNSPPAFNIRHFKREFHQFIPATSLLPWCFYTLLTLHTTCHEQSSGKSGTDKETTVLLKSSYMCLQCEGLQDSGP